jgi:hypothetical protein
MTMLDRNLWHGAGCLSKIGKKVEGIKADEGMITFSEAFGRVYHKNDMRESIRYLTKQFLRLLSAIGSISLVTLIVAGRP